MLIEAHVKISNAESKLSKRSLLYDEDIKLSVSDPRLQQTVGQALEEFERSGQPEEIALNLKINWPIPNGN